MKKILALLLAAIMLLSLTACGSGSDDRDDEESEMEKRAGTYVLESMSADGETVDAEDLGMEAYLELKKNGTGTMTMMGESTEVEWDEDSITVEGEKADLDFRGSRATITVEDEGEMVFKKTTRKPASNQGDDQTGAQIAVVPNPPDPVENENAGTETPDTDFDRVSQRLGDYYVTVVGAERFTDYDDDEAIRVYFDFTNDSDEAVAAFWALNFQMIQDGDEMETTWANYDEEVQESGNSDLNVQPGITIRCAEEFEMDEDDGTLTLTLSEFLGDDDELTIQFDPYDLPGAPTDELEMERIWDPDYVSGRADSGKTDEGHDIAIGEAELFEDEDGENCIRVFLTFTNNGEEETSAFMETTFVAYQDGVELQGAWVWDSESDDLYSEDIEPGETVDCSISFILRTDSPVEISLEQWDADPLGCIFELE